MGHLYRFLCSQVPADMLVHYLRTKQAPELFHICHLDAPETITAIPDAETAGPCVFFLEHVNALPSGDHYTKWGAYLYCRIELPACSAPALLLGLHACEVVAGEHPAAPMPPALFSLQLQSLPAEGKDAMFQTLTMANAFVLNAFRDQHTGTADQHLHPSIQAFLKLLLFLCRCSLPEEVELEPVVVIETDEPQPEPAPIDDAEERKARTRAAVKQAVEVAKAAAAAKKMESERLRVEANRAKKQQAAAQKATAAAATRAGAGKPRFFTIAKPALPKT